MLRQGTSVLFPAQGRVGRRRGGEAGRREGAGGGGIGL